ncbi:MAG TPA: aminotransferase class I/II-fold pyridoxal phosphate-dependent enzyme, partial [Woeseiaceae bacterium]|nr:aminotransferase class I/II-fold pyridoxal phosphate-dependent enzyme [Woeseiaceae bacterium]
PPYLLPSPSVAAAETALSAGALEIAEARIARIIAERDVVAGRLAANPAVRRVFPSETNFLLAEFDDAGAVFAQLQEAGIRVRRFSDPRIENCLRISIGSPAENRAFLQALEPVDA